MKGFPVIPNMCHPLAVRYGVVTSSDSVLQRRTGYNLKRANLVDSEYAAERAWRAAAARQRAAGRYPAGHGVEDSGAWGGRQRSMGW